MLSSLLAGILLTGVLIWAMEKELRPKKVPVKIPARAEK